MDSLMMLGPSDERLKKLFDRLGYDVLVGGDHEKISELMQGTMLDLILVDSRFDGGALDLCEFFRNDPKTKDCPIVYLAHDRNLKEKLKEMNLDRLEVIDGPVSPGVLISRIATQLRLRKMAGLESTEASLADMNASLRDLNQRFSKEREEAREIQQSLLPEQLPADARFQVAISYDPLEDVGGDWYYMQRHESGRVSFQIADVTGHGLAAAFIGSMTKLALTASKEEEPDKLLSSMNRLMASGLPPGRFVTMASALYDPATGALTVTKAGHPSPLVLRQKDKSIEKVGGDGFAVGFLPDGEYKAQTTTLAVGDVVLLVTDGITEAQNRSGHMYGAKRINELLTSLPNDLKASDILARLLSDFSTFTDGRLLKDDVTVIVLRRVQ